MTITRTQYLCLEGLAALRNRHLKHLKDIQKAVNEITQEDDFGHSCDFTWNEDITVDELLEKLDINKPDVAQC